MFSETSIVCDVCGQPHARIRHLPRTYGKAENLLVIENVPVVHCNHCGSRYLTAATLKQIDRIKQDRTATTKRSIAVTTLAQT
jgi:YgiT-type zinc finger domain-containing protein